MTDPQIWWVDSNPSDPSDTRTTAILAASGVVFTVLVVAVLVAVVLVTTHRDSDSGTEDAVLVAANAPLDEPFTRSVLVAPVTISDLAASKAAALLKQVPVRAGRGVRLVSGRQPQLYGATGEAYPCDVATLANYLDADPATAQAWGLALGLAPHQIPHYLNTLTPVVLMGDTWVSSYAMKGGAAQPKQAVLQAGNAVLIDPLGVPRVHCVTGSPLAPPDNDDLTQYRTIGEEWTGFSPQNVVAIKYAAADAPGSAHEFVLIDISTGEQQVRKHGGIIDLRSAGVALPDPAVMNVPPSARR